MQLPRADRDALVRLGGTAVGNHLVSPTTVDVVRSAEPGAVRCPAWETCLKGGGDPRDYPETLKAGWERCEVQSARGTWT